MPFKSLIFLLLFSLFDNAYSAATDAVDTDKTTNLKNAAQQTQWLHLLHYHKAGLFSPYQSQVDDPKFFYSDEGYRDPALELRATIEAFQRDPEQQCRFPARAAWIKQRLAHIHLPEVKCEELALWLEQIDGESLTLIFPAAYLNSPSSMYGHTLLRIDRKNGKNPLLDYSINYAANVDPDDNELVFSYKGLSGGYPGVFSVLPYYEKVNEYSHLESRDVWEYKLNLTKAELTQFLLHTWEVKDSYFDYYFFTENCSYQLLTMLDAASPRFSLSDQFLVTAIPADTVRAINKAGLIKEAVFRPSKLSLMNHLKNQMSPAQIEKAKELVEQEPLIEESLQEFGVSEQAQILELAYQYSRYLSVRKKAQTKTRGRYAIALLSARSKLDVDNVEAPYPIPTTRDDQGHNSRRLQLSFGRVEEQDFADVGLRITYHDFLDPIAGYIKGAQLEMFHLRARQFLDSPSKTRVEEVRLIDIASFSPVSELIQPISWRVSVGATRYIPKNAELVPYLSTGFGYSADWQGHLFYALANVEANLDSHFDKGHRLDLGPRVGWLLQQDHFSFSLEAERPFNLSGEDFDSMKVSAGFGLNLTKDLQIRMQSSYEDFVFEESGNDEQAFTHAASLNIYF